MISVFISCTVGCAAAAAAAAYESRRVHDLTLVAAAMCTLRTDSHNCSNTAAAAAAAAAQLILTTLQLVALALLRV
jgi:hypothetical protein